MQDIFTDKKLKLSKNILSYILYLLKAYKYKIIF